MLISQKNQLFLAAIFGVILGSLNTIINGDGFTAVFILGVIFSSNFYLIRKTSFFVFLTYNVILSLTYLLTIKISDYKMQDIDLFTFIINQFSEVFIFTFLFTLILAGLPYLSYYGFRLP